MRKNENEYVFDTLTLLVEVCVYFFGFTFLLLASQGTEIGAGRQKMTHGNWREWIPERTSCQRQWLLQWPIGEVLTWLPNGRVVSI